MMSILFASLLAVLAVEYFIRCPFEAHARALGIIANKSARAVLSKKISDHWKEVVLLRYARELVIHSVVVALMLFSSVLLVVLPAYLLDLIFVPNPSIIKYISSMSGLSIMTIISLLYMMLRKHIANI
jgi:Trk-type K+ transport system membrane component